jgi:hypothetical protein
MSNPFYTAAGTPSTGALLSSTVRSEFVAIQATASTSPADALRQRLQDRRGQRWRYGSDGRQSRGPAALYSPPAHVTRYAHFRHAHELHGAPGIDRHLRPGRWRRHLPRHALEREPQGGLHRRNRLRRLGLRQHADPRDPVLGAATATSINGLTITSSTGTLTITNAKTLAVSNSATITCTDGATLAFGAGIAITAGKTLSVSNTLTLAGPIRLRSTSMRWPRSSRDLHADSNEHHSIFLRLRQRSNITALAMS